MDWNLVHVNTYHLCIAMSSVYASEMVHSCLWFLCSTTGLARPAANFLRTSSRGRPPIPNTRRKHCPEWKIFYIFCIRKPASAVCLIDRSFRVKFDFVWKLFFDRRGSYSELSNLKFTKQANIVLIMIKNVFDLIGTFDAMSATSTPEW